MINWSLFGTSLGYFSEPRILLLLVFAVLIGAVAGIIPGLGALVTMALLLPFVATMSPTEAFVLLIGVYALTGITGDLTAILVGVPGTPTSAPLVLDGYALTKKGEPLRAMSASVFASGYGAVFGALLLALAIPVVRPLVLAFASPEVLLLVLVGLAMIGGLSGKSVAKGIAAAAFGLLLGSIGPSAQTGVFRYAFSQRYLLDGLELIPLTLGLFGIKELFDLHRHKGAIASRLGPNAVARESGPMLAGFRDAAAKQWLIIRCSWIGAIIGAIPGLGGDVAAWAAYGHAQQTTKDPVPFGSGNIDGVIGPSASNNSKEGGGLIPTIAFGVPGTAAMAILLGAFVMVGVTPGPSMLGTNLDITLFMVWALLFANLLGVLLSLVSLRPLSRLVYVRGSLLLPFIWIFIVIGAGSTTSNVGDLISLAAFGMLSVWMYRGGWPIVPLVLGFVLGPQSENNFSLTVALYGWSAFSRTSVQVLVLLLIATLWYSFFRQKRATVSAEETSSVILAASGTLTVVLALLFGMAGWMARGWPVGARQFPTFVVVIGLLAIVAVFREDQLTRSRRRRQSPGDADSGHVQHLESLDPETGAGGSSAVHLLTTPMVEPSRSWVLRVARSLRSDEVTFFSGFLTSLFGVWLLGLPVALSLSTLLYLWKVDRMRIRKAAFISLVTFVVLQVAVTVAMGFVRLPRGLLM